MLMATAVSQLAEKTPGKESVAIESFARALRQVNKPKSYISYLMIYSFLVTNNHC